MKNVLLLTTLISTLVSCQSKNSWEELSERNVAGTVLSNEKAVVDTSDFAEILSFDPLTKYFWPLSNSGQTVFAKRAGTAGNALLYTSMTASALSAEEAQLHFVSADGSKKTITLNESGEAPDLLNMGNISLEEAHKILQKQAQATTESVKQKAYRAHLKLRDLLQDLASEAH